MLISSRHIARIWDRNWLRSTITAASCRNKASSAALLSTDGASDGGAGVLARESDGVPKPCCFSLTHKCVGRNHKVRTSLSAVADPKGRETESKAGRILSSHDLYLLRSCK
jgi:hypothetical protein